MGGCVIPPDPDNSAVLRYASKNTINHGLGLNSGRWFGPKQRMEDQRVIW